MARIRTASDLGALIRGRRKQLRLGQAELASRIGTTRQWIIGVERGKPRAELGLVLRALDALGIPLTADTKPSTRRPGAPSVDIDAIVRSARKKPS